MSESKRSGPPSGLVSAARWLEDVLVDDVRLERDDDRTEDFDLDGYDDLDLTDVVWVPPEQPAKRGRFAVHEGELALFAVCDDCGETTHTTAEEHLFVPCAHCPGEITLTWEPRER